MISCDEDGVTLTVRVTPRARKSAAAGTVEIGEGRTALAVRLAAPPVDGAANAELTAFLAKLAGVGRSAVSIVAGEKSRVKLVRIEGDARALMRAFSAGEERGMTEG